MEQKDETTACSADSNAQSTEFKKPVLLVGRVGKLPRKAPTEESLPSPLPPQAPPLSPQDLSPAPLQQKQSLPPAVLLKELSTPIPYKEPKWSGLAPEGSKYKFEVLKSGVILETIDLSEKPYYVFGRLANCDIIMAHPTISRHHAVLQYKAFSEEGSSDQQIGWYLYDCGSTHGTFLNRKQLAPRTYCRVKVGHMIKLGCSTRNFILLGPEYDAEGESELTITEMKQKHAEMKAEHEKKMREAAERLEKEKADEETRREEAGIDWGMGEDAEDEPDLFENPYASTANEQLFLDDPKKTLRGFFEREGLELTYDCREQSNGCFICTVELPLDTPNGGSVKAEVVHRGKKKEAVVQCALEACRILDRHGVLRQAEHESRRRKQRDWSADDFYDSDDDTFLERTGDLERKRRDRMRRYGEKKEEERLTFDDLIKKCSDLRTRITREEARLQDMRGAPASAGGVEGEDELDQYMNMLRTQKQSAAHKADISKLKSEIAELKRELSKTERLADIARPTDLPMLQPPPPQQTSGVKMKIASNSVVYGKRIKLKQETAPKMMKDVTRKPDEEFIEEVDSDEDDAKKEQNDIGNESQTYRNYSKDDSRDLSDTNKRENNANSSQNCSVASTVTPMNANDESNFSEIDSPKAAAREKKMYGPMRPPDNYVMPENYFSSGTDRDEQEVMED